MNSNALFRKKSFKERVFPLILQISDTTFAKQAAPVRSLKKEFNFKSTAIPISVQLQGQSKTLFQISVRPQIVVFRTFQHSFLFSDTHFFSFTNAISM